MKGLVSLIGLALLSAGLAAWSWPAGLVAFGLGLYLDQWVPQERRKR